jgi:hypothetical protein
MQKKKWKTSVKKEHVENLFALMTISFIVFLVSELFFRIFALYQHFPPVDIPSHFMVGFASTIGLYWVFVTRKNKWRKSLALLINFGIALLWEILETMEDNLTAQAHYLRDFFLWDGFFDIVTAMIGGFVAIGVLYLLSKRHFLRGLKV